MLSRLIVLFPQVVEAYLNEHRSCGHIHILFERAFLPLLKSNYARKKVVAGRDDRYVCIDLTLFSIIEWYLTIWSNWVTRAGGKILSVTNKKSNGFFLLFDWYDVTVYNDKSHLWFFTMINIRIRIGITKWYKPTVNLLLLRVGGINQANSFDELPTVCDMYLSTRTGRENRMFAH
jgi:hypothetical protein